MIRNWFQIKKRKKQNFGEFYKVPHGDWRDVDHIWMLKTMDEVINTIKKSINESENNINDKEESTLIESSSLQNKPQIFSKEYDEKHVDVLNTDQKKAYDEAVKPIIDHGQVFY